MRRESVVLLFVAWAVSFATVSRAEATRELKGTLPVAGNAPFAVENLCGDMTIERGDSAGVELVATVHAETDALAGAVRVEQVPGEKGVPTLRVRYPIDSSGRVRCLHGGSSHATYDGRRISLDNRRGTLMYADLRVRVPGRTLNGRFVQVAGPIAAEGLAGRLTFDTGSGRITVAKVQGTVLADTGSGSISATAVAGSFKCDTGSGECRVSGFKGDSLSCDTGSGSVRIDSSTAGTVSVDTGSGSIELVGLDAETVKADSGSGAVVVENGGVRLRRVEVDTGSGSVTVRLPASTGFQARADLGSGRVISRFEGAEPILKDDKVVGYTRGDRRVDIAVDTGSGGLTLAPLP